MSNIIPSAAINAGIQGGAVILAGCLRRSRTLPTPAFCALAAIQSVSTTLTQKCIEFVERQVKLVQGNKVDEKLDQTNYLISQALSIPLTLLAIKFLSRGNPLKYDMNTGTPSAYDAGALFCIVAQSTGLTLLAKAMKDLSSRIYNRITGTKTNSIN
jgi:hypothetical protein